MSAEISVIVVNYGTASLAIDAVESVLFRYPVTGRRSVDVHLVDNASPGDDAARLAEAHAARGWGGRVTLYLETVNHGFGRGNNVVLEALAARPAPPDKVFLLNPDARLANDAPSILADFLDAHPRTGAAGARVSKPDSDPVTAAFRFPSILSELQTVASLGPLRRLLDPWTVPLPPERGTGRVDWVTGAAVMFRFKAVAEAGFFDRDYFLYYEEVDLMRRLSRAGWEVWHVAEAEVIHAEGAATQVRSGETLRRRRPDYLYDSSRMYFLKNHGRAYALAWAIVVAGGGMFSHGIAWLRRKPVGLPLRFLADHGRRVLWPLVAGRNP